MIDCSVEVTFFFRKELLLEIVTMKTIDWRKDQEVELQILVQKKEKKCR